MNSLKSEKTAAKQKPVAKQSPAGKQKPATKQKPVAKQSPAGKQKPATKQKTAAKQAPAVKQQPMSMQASTAKQTSTAKQMTAMKQASPAKQTSITKQVWKPGNMLYPVPAVMVSCKTENEKANIITVAWAGTVCSDPAMVSISVRPERYSYHMIKESGEFVVNLVTKDLVFATDYCGVKSGRDVDKFAEMKLTPFEIEGFSAPGIKESPVSIACRVKQVIPLGSHDLFLGEVEHVVVDESLMDPKGKFHLNDSNLVAYSHGEYYALGEYLGKFGYSVKK